MPIARRTVLTGLVLAVAGCATDPVISGAPALAPTSPPPTQSAQDAAALAALVGLRSAVETVGLSAGTDLADWLTPALAQCDAHLALLALPDPFGSDDQTPFTASTPAQAGATTPDEALAALGAAVDAAVEALEAAAAAAEAPDLRLLHASAATASVALRNTALAPEETGAVPVRLQPTTLEASLPIALGHAWALIYGLGVGLGRLGAKDPLQALGTARLAQAKELRNELRDALTTVPEQPAAFELPNAMSTPEEIRAGWAVLETNLLDGYARLVAASDDVTWRERMRGQVTPVQAVGGRLGFWPGWVA